MDYRKKKTYIDLTWDDNNTYQGDTLSSSNSQIALGWQRLLKKSWSTGLIFGATQNSELGTKLRLDLTPLVIRDIAYNNWNRLWVGAGVSAQRETPYDTSGVTNDLAGIVTMVWKVYKYTNPKVWVDADISFVPYFTNQERYRTNFSLNPKISVVGNDLKVGTRFYYTFDSNPTTSVSASYDWGINLELTYTLH